MRDYRKEYDNYHGKPEQRKRRSGRVLARRLMEKKHGKSALKGKDVDHKNGNARDNRPENLRLMNPSLNRSRK